MISNLSTLVNESTSGAVVLYQNGTEIMNGIISYENVVVLGLDNLILIELVEMFILIILLSIFIIRRW
jgi:hypothetical protein